MPRKPLPPAQVVGPEFIGRTLPEDAAAEIAMRMAIDQHHTRVVAVAAQLGYLLPADSIDPDLIQRDIAANMRRSVEACLEVGRGLRVLKEACEHGQFMARLDVLGIEASVARRFMEAATKFANRATSHVLGAAGTQSKLFELLILDDEQIAELELTGKTGELELDDIATMSVKELRQALRAERENYAALDQVAGDKMARIDQLERDNAKLQRRVAEQSPADIGEQIRVEALNLAGQAEVGIRALRAALMAMTEHTAQHGIAHDDLAACMFCQLDRALNELRSEFGVKVAPDGDEVPAWLTAPEPELPSATPAPAEAPRLDMAAAIAESKASGERRGGRSRQQ
ncbi:hypothetical protein [Chitiniphilus shinanonensis]|uniref:hypothetical protein n=1 Tax=Chitiniphilus shinanonensis TaxID=553088 RepID=UPI00306015E0